MSRNWKRSFARTNKTASVDGIFQQPPHRSGFPDNLYASAFVALEAKKRPQIVMKRAEAVAENAQVGSYRNARICAGLFRVVYFSEVLIEPKLVLSWVPTPCTAAMIARAMPAAIKPYSMAVAPDSFLMNVNKETS
jgi:hypothetical protein